MKFALPVLVPFTTDEFEILKFCSTEYTQEFDVLVNYNYQLKNYKLLEKYVDPELQGIFLENLGKDWENHIYNKFFKYFMSLVMRKLKKNPTIEEIKDFYKNEKSFVYKFANIKTSYIYIIEKIYNSIIIFDIPKYNPIHNEINRLYDLVPNFYNPEKILKESFNHLAEGGDVYVKSFCEEKFLFYKPKDIKFKQELSGFKIYRKNVKKRKKIYRKRHKWL